jgi:hypothetical protein
MEMLRFLQQQGAEFSSDTMASAAGAGHLQVCQFLLAEGCPCDHGACREAASFGSLEVLRWLHKLDCPDNATETCAAAAMSGHMHVLEYMQQQGRLPDARGLASALRAAGTEGRLHMAQWLREQGAVWPGRAYGWIFHRDVLQWARQEGCTSHPISKVRPYSMNISYVLYHKQWHCTIAGSACTAAMVTQCNRHLSYSQAAECARGDATVYSCHCVWPQQQQQQQQQLRQQ